MAGWSGLGTGLKSLIAGGGVVSAVAVAAVVWQGRPAPVPPATEPVAEAVPEPVAAAPAPAAPSPAAAPAPAPQEPAASPLAERPPPSFDVVRVESDGAALVAGRAEAGQDVAVLIDGTEAALTQADPQGRFVVFLTLASSADARVMTLELRPDAGAAVPSSDRVLLAPTPRAGTPADPAPEAVAETPQPAETPVAETEVAPAPVAAAVEEVAMPAVEPTSPPLDTASTDVAQSVAPTAEPAGAQAAVVPAAVAEPVAQPDPPAVTEPSAPAPAPQQAVVASEPPEPPSAPPQIAPQAEPIAAASAAPAAILLSGDTVRVLQTPEAAASPPGAITIDTISYTANGAVALSGRGEARAFVRLYLDNRALIEVPIGPDGTWGGTLPAVAPGVYTLRADQVSADGQVTSRFETPFQREDPQTLAAPAAVAQGESAATAQAGKVSITVQPGFTLWQIARETYGDGMLFVRVYDANKTLIRDPDLIYPGQVFTLPQAD